MDKHRMYQEQEPSRGEALIGIACGLLITVIIAGAAAAIASAVCEVAR